MNKKNILEVSSLAIPLDSHGMILLQQKTYDAPNFPSVWSLFGGKKERGETAAEAVSRELKEELGHTFQASDFSYFNTFYFPGDKKTREVFLVSITDDMKLVLLEGRGMGYFTKKEIEILKMPEHIREILSEYFVRTGS